MVTHSFDLLPSWHFLTASSYALCPQAQDVQQSDSDQDGMPPEMGAAPAIAESSDPGSLSSHLSQQQSYNDDAMDNHQLMVYESPEFMAQLAAELLPTTISWTSFLGLANNAFQHIVAVDGRADRSAVATVLQYLQQQLAQVLFQIMS